MPEATDKMATHTPGAEVLRHGVDVYGRVFGAAGGTELEALMRNGDRTAVCAAIYLSPPYDLRVPALPVSRLSVNLTRARVVGGIDGEKHRSFEADRYSMFLAPAGAPMNWRKDSPSRHLTIYFHPDAFDRGDEGPPAFDQAEPVFNASAPGIRHLADQLADELGSSGFLNADAADSLGRLLLVRFARYLRQASASSRPLTSNMLSRLREYVVAHLSERILVADLAKQVGLQPNRFAVTYSEQTGQSPHQFVLALRVENATELLRNSRLSLADVAIACGFANQQHLTNTMRRYLGITPSRYRAEQHAVLGP